ncbi:hypothetical protein F4810DRAFT_211183 [Camillea tinctor]|nr:hypothetical protein F4810DRAFT_211183 [Camillea tinctor]
MNGDGGMLAATTAASAALAGAASEQQYAYNQMRATINNNQLLREPHAHARSNRRAQYNGYSHSYGYPVYHHTTYHIHHAGCPRCYYRDFLTGSIETYKASRDKLRETYIWNLRELSRAYSSQQQPRRPPQQGRLQFSLPALRVHHHLSPQENRLNQEETDAEKLYRYYVWRVREVYDKHCEQHQRLFGKTYLHWVEPERLYIGPHGEIIEGGRRTHLSFGSGSRSGSGSGDSSSSSASSSSGSGSRCSSCCSREERSSAAYRLEEPERRQLCPAPDGPGRNESESGEGQTDRSEETNKE